MHRHLDANARGQVDALEIDVQQIFLDRIVLPIDDHHRRGLAARHRHIENRVVTGLAVQDPLTSLGFTATATASPPAPYSTAGAEPPARSRRASFFPRSLARLGRNRDIFSHARLFALNK